MRRRRTALPLIVGCAALGLAAASASALRAASPAVPRIVTRISAGTANTDASFAGASADGTRVWYQTTEAIPGTGDKDTTADVYERRSNGTTRLISAGVANLDAEFVGASADGSRVWYRTYEAIRGTGDTDAASDIYERRADGSTRLISAGTGNLDAFFVGASADGSRVWYGTTEAIPGTGDTDTAVDVYERRSDGSTRLISAGTADVGASFVGASADGSRVWFETSEAIPGKGDTDTAVDVYERRSDGSTRLISAGTANVGASFAGASADGGRVWFYSSEAIAGTGDTDSVLDIYERKADGSIRLISAGTANLIAGFVGASADGSRVWYETTEAIAGAGDSDTTEDVYERRADGSTRLISAGTADVPAYLAGASADGSRVWYQTTEAIGGTGDTNTVNDLYEREPNGRTLLLSPGTVVDVHYVGASRNGGRIWFTTNQSIPGKGDADVAVDVYETAVPSPHVTRRARIAGTASVGRTLTCAATIVGAESTTYAWKRGSHTIAHATNRTRTATRLDRGQKLRCTISATSRTGRATSTSPARLVP